jgi:hypothetical protein
MITSGMEEPMGLLVERKEWTCSENELCMIELIDCECPCTLLNILK